MARAARAAAVSTPGLCELPCQARLGPVLVGLRHTSLCCCCYRCSLAAARDRRPGIPRQDTRADKVVAATAWTSNQSSTQLLHAPTPVHLNRRSSTPCANTSLPRPAFPSCPSDCLLACPSIVPKTVNHKRNCSSPLPALSRPDHTLVASILLSVQPTRAREKDTSIKHARRKRNKVDFSAPSQQHQAVTAPRRTAPSAPAVSASTSAATAAACPRGQPRPPTSAPAKPLH